MSKNGNHTLDTVCKRLGGYVTVYPSIEDLQWRARIRACSGALIAGGIGKTEAAAKAALARKLRATAKAILSDEWEF